MEECPGTWGWAVLGIPAKELGKTLEQFQNVMVRSLFSMPRLFLACGGRLTQRPNREFRLLKEPRLVSMKTDGAPS